MTLVLAGEHGREDGVVGKLNVVVFGRRSDFAKGGTLALLGHSSDVCGHRSLLEGIVRLLSVSLLAPGENPRSSDRAVATLLCHTLLEDTVLEVTACGSPMVVWRRWSPNGDSSLGDL
jgi:hypothetical protein